MSMISPEVGLSILLSPATGSALMSTACGVVGCAYPAYKALKAIENDKADGEDVQWLTYWSVYGSLSLVERCSDFLLGWFPWYYHAKLGFLLWLMLPRFQGAKVLYERFIRPALHKYQDSIDSVLGKIEKSMDAYIDSQEGNFNMLKGMYEKLLPHVKEFQSKANNRLSKGGSS